MHILIVEDEPTLLENLQWMLELEGYTVTTAGDGLDALAKCQAQPPDLILTDVMMPRLDGYGLVQALREDAHLGSLPIIMLTAKADRSDVRQGMSMGADDYLIKPYRREELLDAITVRLSRSQRQHKDLQRQHDHLRQALNRDPLTALANRRGFEQSVALDLTLCPQAGDMTVLCLGLDGFSKINDSYGSLVGDEVLRQVAQRLSFQALQPDLKDTQVEIARLGGDCFGLCLNTPLLRQPLQALIAQILTALKLPVLAHQHQLHLNASVGVSQSGPAGTSATDLLLNAESALHHAKLAGPGSVQIFDAAMNQQVMRRLHIHNELHDAVAKHQLQVYYQPQIDIQSGRVCGFEALSRWQHPTLGWVSPAEFIAVAEESGIIVELGTQVLRTAAAQAAQWLALGHTDFRMAVNLSVRQFVDEHLPEQVAQTLRETGLPAHMLELEITESLALQSITTTLATLQQLKSLGIQLSMDDFGTGYSSLAYLKRYPLDALKVDQSFIRNIPHDAGDVAITQTVIAMAHSFGMRVIAEGVEHCEQLNFLRPLGCEEFQGYLFSQPLPAHQAVACFAGYHAKAVNQAQAAQVTTPDQAVASTTSPNPMR